MTLALAKSLSVATSVWKTRLAKVKGVVDPNDPSSDPSSGPGDLL